MGLDERQIETLQLMVNEGKDITSNLYQKLFGVSRRTATRDLAGLVETGWVRKIDTDKGTRYTTGQDGA